jgi:hypothetical protein
MIKIEVFMIDKSRDKKNGYMWYFLKKNKKESRDKGEINKFNQIYHFLVAQLFNFSFFYCCFFLERKFN